MKKKEIVVLVVIVVIISHIYQVGRICMVVLSANPPSYDHDHKIVSGGEPLIPPFHWRKNSLNATSGPMKFAESQ